MVGWHEQWCRNKQRDYRVSTCCATNDVDADRPIKWSIRSQGRKCLSEKELANYKQPLCEVWQSAGQFMRDGRRTDPGDQQAVLKKVNDDGDHLERRRSLRALRRFRKLRPSALTRPGYSPGAVG